MMFSSLRSQEPAADPKARDVLVGSGVETGAVLFSYRG